MTIRIHTGNSTYEVDQLRKQVRRLRSETPEAERNWDVRDGDWQDYTNVEGLQVGCRTYFTLPGEPHRLMTSGVTRIEIVRPEFEYPVRGYTYLLGEYVVCKQTAGIFQVTRIGLDGVNLTIKSPGPGRKIEIHGELPTTNLQSLRHAFTLEDGSPIEPCTRTSTPQASATS